MNQETPLAQPARGARAGGKSVVCGLVPWLCWVLRAHRVRGLMRGCWGRPPRRRSHCSWTSKDKGMLRGQDRDCPSWREQLR